MKYRNEKCTTTYYDSESCSYKNKEKKKHKTLDEAIKAAKVMNCKESTIYKVIAYKCTSCGSYHIGRGTKLITPKERDKFKKELDFEWECNIVKIRNKRNVQNSI